MRKSLKKIRLIKYLYLSWKIMKHPFSYSLRVRSLFNFFADYKKYARINKNKAFKLEPADLYPRIYDKTPVTGLDPIYFLQGTWCAKKIFENKPARHYDVGSQALMVGIISQFVPTTMVDIRPLTVTLRELSFQNGDVTRLPFADNSISSLSSICVIEHIGLGRYGDEIDDHGSEKAAKELSRVLANKGDLYISVPVDSENRIYFNAHRAFTREYVMDMFSGLILKEEKYIYGNGMENAYSGGKGFGTGLYHFTK